MSKRVASLSGAVLQLSTLREDGRAELVDILDALPGRKCLVLESHIGGLLNHVIPEGSKLLREKGVTYFRELRGELGEFLDQNGRPAEPDHIVYLVRASIPHMKIIAKQINSRSKAGAKIDIRYKVYFVPHRSLICEQVLREEGVLRKVDIGDYPLDLVPLDRDVLSLEMDSLFKQVHLEGEASGLTIVARSIQKLQTVYGVIPNVKAKGSGAAATLQRCMRLRYEEHPVDGVGDSGGGAGGGVPPRIDTLVLLDREIDLVTPLVTPLTYEGLINELLGIHNGCVKLDAEIAEAGEGVDGAGSGGGGGGGGDEERSSREESLDKSRQVPVALNADDSLFASIRDLNIEQLGPFLQEKAKDIRESFSKFRTKRDQSITQIHAFVKKIPELNQEYKSLNRHINIAELVKRTSGSAAFRRRWQTERTMLEGDDCYETIEELINMQEPPLEVLRLICLQSMTDAGIRSSKYDFLKKEIVQTYGYEYLYAINNLENLGLLRKRDKVWVGPTDSSSVPWPMLRRTLRLINDSPDDISYVSSGYAPLSVRLVQASARPGWMAFAETLKLLPGPAVEVMQDPDNPEDLATALRRQVDQEMKLEAGTGPVVSGQDQGGLPFGVGGVPGRPGELAGGEGDSLSKKVLLVYFVGGVTYMEIAALRFLSGRRDFPFQVVIATTKIINGNSFVESLLPGFQNLLQR